MRFVFVHKGDEITHLVKRYVVLTIIKVGVLTATFEGATKTGSCA